MYTHRECINFKLMIEPNTLPNYSAKTHTKNTHIVLWSLSSESLRRAVFLRPLKEWYGVKLIQWYDLGYDSPRRGISDFICKRAKKAKAERGEEGAFLGHVCLSQTLLPRHVDHSHPSVLCPPCLISDPTNKPCKQHILSDGIFLMFGQMILLAIYHILKF